jgi:hypothetical protein
MGNVALGADERAALAAGVSPFLVRPANLKDWFPLFGFSDPEMNYATPGRGLAITGTPPSANPPPVTLFTTPPASFLGEVGGEEEKYIKFDTSFLIEKLERYLKFDTDIVPWEHPYVKFDASLLLEAGAYLKTDTVFAQALEKFVKFNTAFTTWDEYLKFDSSLEGKREAFIRFATLFAYGARYMKFKALLTNAPVLGDLGGSPAAGATGLLARQYLSIESIKKEV